MVGGGASIVYIACVAGPSLACPPPPSSRRALFLPAYSFLLDERYLPLAVFPQRQFGAPDPTAPLKLALTKLNCAGLPTNCTQTEQCPSRRTRYLSSSAREPPATGASRRPRIPQRMVSLSLFAFSISWARTKPTSWRGELCCCIAQGMTQDGVQSGVEHMEHVGGLEDTHSLIPGNLHLRPRALMIGSHRMHTLVPCC